MIRLHDYPLSSASYRVRIALNLKGIAYESYHYALRAGEQRSPQYLALNPAGLVPCLEIDGHTFTQSLAIIDYLEITRPTPALFPSSAVERGRALSLAQTVCSDIHPLNNLRVLLYLEQELHADAHARANWYGHWIHAGFSALEATLARRSEYPYAMGDEPGIVDICLVPQVFNARRFHVDLTAYPRLVAVADRALKHPAFERAAPPHG